MKISYSSGIYHFEVVQQLNTTLHEAWEFFSNPKNLQKITPDNVGFSIQKLDGEKMYEGQIITYKIKLFPFYKANWVTEIKYVDFEKSFIDEQLFGPYRLWHHKHSFEEVDGKVEMTDSIHFKLPLGFIGRLAYPLLVKPRLEKIFSFRFNYLENKFN